MSETEALHAFERKLLRHCAPTLAAIKPGSLFNCCTKSCSAASAASAGPTALPLEGIARIIARCRAKLAPFGVKLDILASSATGILVYAWHPAALKSVLADREIGAFIAQAGYDVGDPQRCIETLRSRIRTSRADARPCACTFPHEIGIFLGYPLADVVGFIENKGENFLCCGYWKAYSHAERAQATFARWRRCTAESLALFDGGAFIEDVVADLQDYPMPDALSRAS